jgi:uncharacterized protein
MLLIKTKLAESSIHGMGIFAGERILRGNDVWQFFPNFDLERSVSEVNDLPLHAQEWFKQYAYLDYRLGCYILSIDHARFINHSEKPNVIPDFDRDRHGIGVANKDIDIDEEITIDYRLIEKDNWLSR